MDVAGVDGARRGWVAVRLTDGRFAEARFFNTFGDLAQAYPEAAVIAVDIPIGLPDRNHRAADERAREELGGRRNSVFFTPPRRALEAGDFDQAVKIAHSLGGTISQQGYALRKKIFEVECFISDPRIVEVHPEVSFWAMNGQRPLPHAKSTWNGLMMRVELVRRHGVELPRTLKGMDKAGADDVLDAAAAAWSAWRVARGQADSLPESPEVGPTGRAVAIWY